MLRHANNYKRIYEMYNFDFDPEPGTAQYKVDQRIKRVRRGMRVWARRGRAGSGCGGSIESRDEREASVWQANAHPRAIGPFAICISRFCVESSAAEIPFVCICI